MYDWIIAQPVLDDKYYFRSDDHIIHKLLTGRHNIIRVLGIRRFGKTSFLRKIERYLTTDKKCKDVWKTHFFTMRCHDQNIEINSRKIAEYRHLLDNDENIRVLFLIDEMNSVNDDPDDSVKSQRAKLINEIVTHSSSGAYGNRFRAVISEASNMEEVLLTAQFVDREVLNLINEGSTYYLPAFTQSEKLELLKNVSGVSFDSIPMAMIDYVGRHPLLVQMLGSFLDESEDAGLEDFREYLEDNAGSDYRSIYDNLHSLEKLVLRRLVHEKDPLDSKLLTSPGGAVGGLSVTRRLVEFGLVQGTSNGDFVIGIPAFSEYILRRFPLAPHLENSDTLIAQWRELFDDKHPNDKGKQSAFLIHHMADFHIPSDFSSTDKHCTLKAYGSELERLDRAEPLLKPHVIVLAGDLIKQDNTQKDSDDYNIPLDIVREFLRNQLVSHGQRLNSDLSPIIVVAGDTDAIIKVKTCGATQTKSYQHEFKAFNNGFNAFSRAHDYLSPQYYRDWNVLIIPLNSANPSEIQDVNTLGELRLKLRTEVDFDGTQYEKHRISEYGCLPEDLSEHLGKMISKLRPDGDIDFDHALRIVVFHHHLEQLTSATTVDFKDVEKIKKAMAKNKISVMLHGHAHRNLVFSETFYPQNTNKHAWIMHAICCGAMFHESPLGNPKSFNSIKIMREPASSTHKKHAKNRGVDTPKFCYSVEVRPYTLGQEDGFSDSDGVVSLEVVR